ncbi:hypothetical protein KBC86_05425 [Candidatus Gracilibacteria bacterium]|nr:hypothetical protein [Candidatus Gracilibacteria bacterium]
MTTLVSPIALARTVLNTNLIPGGKGEVYGVYLHAVGRAELFSTEVLRDLFVAGSGINLVQHAALVRLLETSKITTDDIADSLSEMLANGKSAIQSLARETELTADDHELADKVGKHLASARFTALSFISKDDIDLGTYTDYLLTDYGRELLAQLEAGQTVMILPPGITETSSSVQVALPLELDHWIGNGGVKVLLNLPELRAFLAENPTFDYESSDGLVVDTLKKIEV